jgi:iron complex outermembrane receptor protein
MRALRSDKKFGIGARAAAILGSTLISAVCFADANNGSADTSADAGEGLAEVTITAEKYKSTIQDTPISISAVSGDQLTATGTTTIEDVAREVPGFSQRSAGPGQTEYEARGLASNGGAAPTVGFYLDEVPLSPPALSQAGKVVIDPNLYDIERVEILRGPQGTLYGSGSMGGTVKVITNEPKLGIFEGSVQATGSGTEGGGANGGGNLMLNLPLGDVLALRVVGSDSYRSGWLDRDVVNPFPTDVGPVRGNVLAGPVTAVHKDVNWQQEYGARASLLFQPNEDVSILASVFYQHQKEGGYDEFDAPPGAHYLTHYEAFDVPEPLQDQIRIYSLTGTFNLGFADLTSATSYWNRFSDQTQDASESIFDSNGGSTPLVPLPYSEVDPSHQFSQEVRLTSRNDEQLHWVAGLFYSDLHSTWIEQSANQLITASANGVIFDSINPYHVRQYAAFADGSYKITDQWKFEAGLRWYRYLSEQDELEWGFDGPYPTEPAAPTITKASDKGFNPRFDLSYSPDADLTTYISASRGFRPGGANQIFPPYTQPPFCSPAPLTFGPDTAWDYEIGEKAKLFDNRVSINSDFFYIKWDGIQQAPLLGCGYEYDTNAGDGYTYGPELEITARITDSLTALANGAYTEAKISEPNANFINYLEKIAPAASPALQPGGPAYCPTPTNCRAPILNVPKDEGSLSLVYAATVMDGYNFSARVSDVFVGPTIDEAYYYGIRLPPYNIANARLILGRDKWSVHLFVDNLTNRVAELTANNTSFQFNIPSLIRYSTNQPRTIGTQLNYRF